VKSLRTYIICISNEYNQRAIAQELNKNELNSLLIKII